MLLCYTLQSVIACSYVQRKTSHTCEHRIEQLGTNALPLTAAFYDSQ
jgi:hypothetical protein